LRLTSFQSKMRSAARSRSVANSDMTTVCHELACGARRAARF
jgi:hypothetical protein